jgi:hypothetical protein
MNTIGFKRCSNKHILGQIRQNGSHVEILELFRQAIDYGEDIPEAVDVVAVIVGRATGIRCSICGDAIEWNQSAQGQKRALAVFE